MTKVCPFPAALVVLLFARLLRLFLAIYCSGNLITADAQLLCRKPSPMFFTRGNMAQRERVIHRSYLSLEEDSFLTAGDRHTIDSKK